jgi:hypothetical protein
MSFKKPCKKLINHLEILPHSKLTELFAKNNLCENE